MTFLTVAIFASPATLIDRTPDRRLQWRVPAAAIALLIVMSIFGAIRLSLHPTTTVSGAKLRLMQPNLQQDAKFNYAAKAEVMKNTWRCRTAPPARNRPACVMLRS